MAYVDGFLIAVPRKNLKAYAKMANVGKRVWMKHGALDYQECVGDDMTVHPGCGAGFPHLLKLKPGEIAVFSYIYYKSRKHRDQVNAKVFKDMEMHGDFKKMPFDMKRMHSGGFKVIVGV
jgi:uncharacterized protein YbaA (DUF1428 family)